MGWLRAGAEATAPRGNLAWGGDPLSILVGEGGLAWLLGQAHLTLSRRLYLSCLAWGPWIDKSVPVRQFHCLETT